MPNLNTGTLSATGSVTHYKSNRAPWAAFTFSGTYGTVTLVFEISQDGTTWTATSAVLASSGAVATGTISPTDNTSYTYNVRCPDVQYVRLRVTAIASGSVAVSATSDDLSVVPASPTYVLASADGAIGIKEGTVFITKGSAAALTLAAPTATVDDGKKLLIISTTDFAHTVTASPGFNGDTTSADVATFTNTAGATLEAVAYQGVWYATITKSVTLA